jgi:hypothetical protein
MRDDDEGETALGRHGAEELLQRLDAAGRSADADDGERWLRVAIGHERLSESLGARVARYRVSASPSLKISKANL